MAYDYGSQSLGIRNPFRIEGALVALRGGLMLALGMYCCWRRPKNDPPCRLKIDPGKIADFSLSNCG